jgi:hypothetical protein
VRLAHFEAVEHGQRLSGLHPIAEIDVDLDDAPRHAWRDMGDAILVGADGGGHDQLLADFLRREFFDLDPGGFDLLGAELQLLLLAVSGFAFLVLAFLSPVLVGDAPGFAAARLRRRRRRLAPVCRSRPGRCSPGEGQQDAQFRS